LSSNSNSSDKPSSHAAKPSASTVHRDTASSEIGEDQALAILQRADVAAEVLAQLARNPGVLKSRKVLQALAAHSRTPRHISISLLRRMFTFDLMQLALTPAVRADIKRTAEEQISLRLDSLSAGEKISLARRGPSRVAAELLKEKDVRILSVALNNGRLVEAGVVTALMRRDASQLLFKQVSEHPKWSQQLEVQIALLRSENTPLDRAIAFARHFSPEKLREILPQSRRPELMSASQLADQRSK
jgi:hypothetical protein